MIDVAAAIIANEQGEILIARRKKGKALEGLWEFPGGKIEGKETAEECLKRELREELNIEIQPCEWFGENEHDYGNIHIRLIAIKAKYVGGKVTLVDHDQYKWISPGELIKYEFAPADIVFVEKLMSAHRTGRA